MSLPKLYWNRFSQDAVFNNIINAIKTDISPSSESGNSPNLEFELRFGIPARSKYDGVYNFNSNIGPFMFNKYREILDNIKSPQVLNTQVSRKSLQQPGQKPVPQSEPGSIRKVGNTYTIKNPLNKADNLISIQSITNQSIGDSRNLFVLRFALSRETVTNAQTFSELKSPEKSFQRTRYSYDFYPIVLDLTHDYTNNEEGINDMYSLEMEYKTDFLKSLKDTPLLDNKKAIFNPIKEVFSILFPDVSDIYEFNTYQEVLSLGWRFKQDQPAYPKVLNRPVNISRSNIPILFEGYNFTNKLNGVHFRLIITNFNGFADKYIAYLINDLEIRILSIDNQLLREFNNTVIDVEFFQNQLWVFDCPVYKARNNTLRSHDERIQFIQNDYSQLSNALKFPFFIKKFFYKNDPAQSLKEVLTYMYNKFGDTTEKDNDGIIMTPVGKYMDPNGKERSKSYYDQKYNIYKWKFPSTVSIDFTLKQIDTYTEGDRTYKVFNLLVMDDNRLVTMSPFRSDNLQLEFTPPTVYKCNNTHRHYNELVTGKIVEMTFDKSINSFVFYHIRTDKTRPNGIKTAKDTFIDMAYEFSLKEFESLLNIHWRQIKDSSSGAIFYIDLLTGQKSNTQPEKFFTLETAQQFKKYDKKESKQQENTHCLKEYRDYHNVVKRVLISEYTANKSVVDLGAGKGGDLAKYRDARVKFLWAVEPLISNLEDYEDGMYRRMQNIWKSANFHKYSPELKTVTKTSVPIMTIHTGAQDTNTIRKAMILTHKSYKPLGENLEYADVVTSFFSMSFFFSSSDMLDSIINTVNNCLPVGGLFVGTMMDGQKTYDILQRSNGIIQYPNCYYIKRQYDPNLSLGIGQQIAINLSGTPTVEGEQTEWLSPFHILEERLRFKNIKLVKRFDLDDYKDLGLPNPQLTPAQKELSSLYIGFVFQKLSQREAESERKLGMLSFKDIEEGNYVSSDIYTEKLYRTGVTAEGSCFFSSLLISMICDGSTEQFNLLDRLDLDDIQFLTYAMRKVISNRITFELYTTVRTTESIPKLLNAVNEYRFSKISDNQLERITDELMAQYYTMLEDPSVTGYHNTIKSKLISRMQAINPKIKSEDIDEIDQEKFEEYQKRVARPTSWANNTMFDIISIITDINIIIIKDTTGSSYQYISCNVYKKTNPFVIFINLGGGDGVHFEPINIINPDGSKKYIFSFEDEIVNKLYNKICEIKREEIVDGIYYPPALRKQLKALSQLDYPRLSSLVYKSTNSSNCVYMLTQPYEDDMELLMKFRECKSKSDGSEFIPVRQNARRRDVKNILEQISPRPQITSYMDFGGGDGAISSAVAKSLNISQDRAYSADITEWFTREIKKPYDNLIYITISPDTPLKLPDNSIDLVTAFQVLHHVENIKFAIKDLHRVLRSGGILIIREHNCENSTDRMMCDVEHSLYEVAMEAQPNMSFLDKYHAWYRDQKQWIDLITNNGFRHMDLNYPYKPSQTKYYYDAFVAVK
jgi:ubiquinone/menaquinone biosynthesis C-methylase UbiE